MIMRSKTGTVRVIDARHNFVRKTWYQELGV
jgi:fructose-1,6-bisphosphatase II / sedoheptulose-1,7-bisphosphatase